MPYNVELTLFIVLAIAIGSAFLFWFGFGPVQRYYRKRHTVKAYYPKVYRVALDNDFYLINNFSNRTAESEEFHIDHILIGNKFIYVIRDRYYDGALAAKETDQSWIFFHGKKGRYVPNPVIMNKLRMQRLSLMSGIDEKFFISVVLINDDCYLTPYESQTDNSFLSSLRDFPRLIEEIEARDVAPLDPQAIAVVARDFAELNQTPHGK